MKTIVHAYSYDTSKPEDKAAYEALCSMLKDLPRRMKSHTGDGLNNGGYHRTGQSLDGQTIELETAYLFENQWNTAPIPGFSENGYRVFDWAEDAYFSAGGRENLTLRTGYWLEQTEEMQAIRHNTLKCGYCGKYEPADCGKVFCDKCIDSEYLKASDLSLTRLRRIDEKFNDIPELTESERSEREPVYYEAQKSGTTERGKARIAKMRRELAEKKQKAIDNAEAEFDGFHWLIDNGFGVMAAQNVIYYSHTGQFCFGWRRPLDAHEESDLLNKISEFRWSYEIKRASGKPLTAV